MKTAFRLGLAAIVLDSSRFELLLLSQGQLGGFSSTQSADALDILVSKTDESLNVLMIV